ncbi:phosphoserine phosphatase [Pantoea sp. Aalb]|uniref:phosphoserine phosphatase n=1 Tax=Pantoea sp. Aalb TaxID=2576762 RepID=UPI00132619A6|nr:phosphoserine phosphatase [Pantoea sp. Aalb]MXP67149.1 phosphoserine phosphatase [Pantoea sp. Aalb]
MLPLSLISNKSIYLNNNISLNSWLLYRRVSNTQKIIDYKNQFGNNIKFLNSWYVDGYKVIHLSGPLTKHITKLAHQAGFDVAPYYNIPTLNKPGLLIMDMDSTAIQIECIDALAELAGYGNQVAEITKLTMLGELDFKTSLYKRVSILNGADANILQQVLDKVSLMPGLTRLVYILKKFGWHVAIASGGFTFCANYLSQILHLSYIIANELEIYRGKLTGKIIGKIIDAQVKVETLYNLTQRYCIAPEQTIAIGDGANDLPMLKAAALGIAYHAKPIVNEQTNVIICHADLIGVLCILSGSLI